MANGTQLMWGRVLDACKRLAPRSTFLLVASETRADALMIRHWQNASVFRDLVLELGDWGVLAGSWYEGRATEPDQRTRVALNPPDGSAESVARAYVDHLASAWKSDLAFKDSLASLTTQYAQQTAQTRGAARSNADRLLGIYERTSAEVGLLPWAPGNDARLGYLFAVTGPDGVRCAGFETAPGKVPLVFTAENLISARKVSRGLNIVVEVTLRANDGSGDAFRIGVRGPAGRLSAIFAYLGYPL